MDHKIKLVIFDMDGVLVDSEPAIRFAAMQALKERDLVVSFDDFKPFTGMGDDKFIAGVAAKYGMGYDVSMKERAYEIYIEKSKERVIVFDWSKKIIQSLHGDGFALAIASASDLVKVSCNISCIGVDRALFAAIVTGSDVVNKKPAPDIFLKAAEKSGISSDRALVIEDAVSGVMAAKAAGMLCIGVTSTFAKEDLFAAGADYVLDDLSGAPAIIKSL